MPVDTSLLVAIPLAARHGLRRLPTDAISPSLVLTVSAGTVTAALPSFLLLRPSVPLWLLKRMRVRPR